MKINIVPISPKMEEEFAILVNEYKDAIIEIATTSFNHGVVHGAQTAGCAILISSIILRFYIKAREHHHIKGMKKK